MPSCDPIVPRRLFFTPRHNDGHHKLIKWGTLMHGAIDGNTRCVVWMRVANDNLATTPLQCFRGAVAEYQVPMHMVGDYGGENVLVADAMIRHRGYDAQAYKCGSSRYNTRIERLWREVRRMVRASPLLYALWSGLSLTHILCVFLTPLFPISLLLSSLLALATFTANVPPLRREDDRGTLDDRYVQALAYANSLV